MNQAPLILISPCTQRRGAEFADPSLSLSEAYLRAVSAAGGIPCALPIDSNRELVAQCVHRSDGVMLSGGDDVEPKLYAPRLPSRVRKMVGKPDRRRDLMELILIEEVFRQRKPLLAICRGQQILNVAFGGTLLADIALQRPGTINHRRIDWKDRLVHGLDVEPGSHLHLVFGGSRIRVNSSHHQAVDVLAEPFRATAWSPDGIIEAFELKAENRHWLPYMVAVQFHPERLTRRHPEFLELFRSFVQVCASECKRKV